MTTHTVVTIWHKAYDPETRLNTWKPAEFAASVRKEEKAVPTDKGLSRASVIKVRIPTTREIKISTGDKLAAGAHRETSPPSGAYTVTAFADNRRGSRSVWHWKVVCEC